MCMHTLTLKLLNSFIFRIKKSLEIDHVQQGGERMESGGHSNSFEGARTVNAPALGWG